MDKEIAMYLIINTILKYKMQALGACRNSFFVFVSDRSRSGLAENLVSLKSCALNKN